MICFVLALALTFELGGGGGGVGSAYLKSSVYSTPYFYYKLSLPAQFSIVLHEKDLKAIMHFHFLTNMATPKYKIHTMYELFHSREKMW